ncbi:unnamed protein product [Candidula unifasciata]|uniref:G-protein coupled receptors family 1 profile domain-containing protein n=1 Tax=Candidula unifasciata TaxID=100452 RepID=A0A8S3ZL09_9EUPU|nr:unnamed protein product [Candidula unifasciata]
MNNNTVYTTVLLDIVSNYQYIIVVIVCSVSWIILSLLGIASNMINIITFVAMGLNDGVTVSFLALSFFDLMYVIASFCLGLASALGTVEVLTLTRYAVDPYGLSVLVANIMILLIVTNVLATTFIAVARCMCVVKPLQFKNTFTVLRTVYFMAGFAIFAVAIYTPILANMGMVTGFDNTTKRYRTSLWLPRHREAIKNVIFVIIDLLLPVSTQVIVVFCIVLMANSLQASSRFRQTSKIQTCNKETSISFKENASDSDRLSGKERRVINQVIVISVVYIICNTPKILISVANVTEAEFRIGRRYHNFYLVINFFRKHLEIFNATINTFIYFKYNNKFRNTVVSKWNL